MTPYVVRQGDYLDKIAHALGFDAETVWSDPSNADLKALRDPNMLLPGDILQVPDAEPKPLGLAGGTSNDYAAAVPRTSMKLVFSTVKDGPLANEAYVLDGLGDPVEGSTDGDGAVTLEIPVHLREVKLSFPRLKLVYPVGIGDMDPADDAAGIRKRLQHLAYREMPAPDDGDAPSDDEVAALDRDAIAAFQRAHDLEPTGKVDDATKDAIVKAHGS